VVQEARRADREDLFEDAVDEMCVKSLLFDAFGADLIAFLCCFDSPLGHGSRQRLEILIGLSVADDGIK
jgi:hypothetical protein